MTLPRDPEHVRQVLSDAIGLLCRNGFSFEVELSVDALIGITIDRHEVLLVSIKDTFTDSRRKSVSLGYFDGPQSFINSSETEENHSVRVSTKNSARKRSHSSNVDHLRYCKKLLVTNPPPAEGNCPKFAVSCRKKVAADEDSGKMVANAHTFNEAEMKTFESECVRPKSEIINDVCAVGNAVSDSRTPSASESGVIGCAQETLPQSSSDESIGFTEQRQHNQLSESDREDAWRVFSLEGQTIFSSPDTVSCFQKNSLETLPCIGVMYAAVEKQRDKEEHLQSPLNLRDCSSNSNCLLTSEDKPTSCDQTKHTTQKQRNRAASLCSQEKSFDGGVVCVKEEAMSLDESDRFGPVSALRAIGDFREAVLSAAPVADYHLESVAFHQLHRWKDSQDSVFSGVRRDAGESDCRHLMLSDLQDGLASDVHLAIHSILLYDGQYVPLRDIQRLRLCGMVAGKIKFAMEQLSSFGGKLGCFQVLHGGVNLFYKCPPSLVDRESLESFYGIPWKKYKFHYDTTPALNVTTRHNDQYWLKVASGSPYIRYSY